MSGFGAAQAAKEKGNAAFKAGDFVGAIGHYTDAALADRLEPTYPLNRAAAYLKLGKHADAERDCSTCLALSPGNVKALFRRAQARLALRKLDEAEKDLNDALKREPANDAVKQELAKLKQIRAQAAAPKKAPVSLPTPPLAGSSIPEPTNKRRRIPITIDRISTVKEVPPAAHTSGANTTRAAPDLLTPVSSRPLGKDGGVADSASKPAPLKSILKPSRADRGPLIVTPTASKPAVPDPTPKPARRHYDRGPQIDEETFARWNNQAHEEQQHVDRGPLISPETVAEASPEPSLPPRPARGPAIRGRGPQIVDPRELAPARGKVGGGIFRQNGSHELFKNSDGDTLANASAPAPPLPARETGARLPLPVEPGKAKATTLFALQREWTNRSTAAARWELLCTVPPSGLPAICKNLLEPAFLVAILEAFRELAAEERVQPAMREYMSWLAKVSRFDTVVMFLSARERKIAQEVLRALGIKSWAGISV